MKQTQEQRSSGCRAMRKERVRSGEGEVAVGVLLIRDSTQGWLPVAAVALAHRLGRVEEAGKRGKHSQAEDGGRHSDLGSKKKFVGGCSSRQST